MKFFESSQRSSLVQIFLGESKLFDPFQEKILEMYNVRTVEEFLLATNTPQKHDAMSKILGITPKQVSRLIAASRNKLEALQLIPERCRQEPVDCILAPQGIITQRKCVK